MKKESVAWNIAGLALPLIMAFVAIPVLLTRLGPERFGLLSLAWTFTAMSGLLDLGVGRATTRLLAEALGAGKKGSASAACATAERISLGFGLVGTGIFLVAIALGAVQQLRFDPDLTTEVILSAATLAAIIPLQSLIATYRGIAEGVQSFRALNILRIILGAANFGIPALASYFTNALHWLVLALFAIRFIALFAFRKLAKAQLAKEGVNQGRWCRVEAGNLLRSARWLTVSTCAGPLLATADRFFIGSAISAAAIAAYAVPYELVMQPLILASAMATVAFPALARSLVVDQARAQQSERRWLIFSAGALGSVAVLLAMVLEPILVLWLQMPAEPTSVISGYWLCIGMWLNGLGQMLIASIHARGNFKAPAVLHTAELLVYLTALAVVIPIYGIVGAAILWSARAMVDTSGLYWIWRRELTRELRAQP